MAVRAHASILFTYSYGTGKGTVYRGRASCLAVGALGCIPGGGSTRDGPRVTVGRILKCIYSLSITKTTCG